GRRARGCYPCRISSTGRMRGIQFQYLIFGVPQFQARCQDNLNELFPHRPRRAFAGEPDHLHGDRTSTAHHPAGLEVSESSTTHGCRINTRMIIEAFILKCQQCFPELVRYNPGLGETPLSVSRYCSTQEVSVTIFQHSGIRHLEQYFRKTEVVTYGSGKEQKPRVLPLPL